MIELSKEQMRLDASDVLMHVCSGLNDEEVTRAAVLIRYATGYVPSGIEYEATKLERTGDNEMTITYDNGQKFRIVIMKD